ncbi:hypothetical protein ACFLS1_06045 [Verrucomicrobiota bacterium]
MAEQQKKDKEKKDKGKSQNAEEKIWDAISAFEQILEALPGDMASLEALSHAYEQIGDHARAKDYTIRLGEVLVKESDVEAAAVILDKIRSYADEDPQAQELAGTIEKLISDQKVQQVGEGVITEETSSQERKDDVKATEGFNISEELSFAWNLLEAKELTQEEYSSVVQDLTDLSASEGNAAVSVLHVLEGRRFKRLEKIITFAARECGIPIVSISNFELQSEAVSVLPMEFIVRRGALVFEFLGNDALVVIMNPYDNKLRKDITQLADRNCHFFLTLPSEFDRAVEKIPEIVDEKSESAVE